MGTFEDLYRRHVQAVFRFACHVTGDRATAKVSQGDDSATFELEKTGDGWQISSLGGSG